MNTPSRPVFGSSRITPQSVGYSYLPGATLATIAAPVPIRTFGTSASPQPGSSPITPRRVGSLTIPGASGKTGIVGRVTSGLFA